MKTTKSKEVPPMQLEGYRVQIADAGGSPIAVTWEMTLNDALSVVREWKPIDGTVSILVPKPSDKR